MALDKNEFLRILTCASEAGVSDVFVSEGTAVHWRRCGVMSPLKEYVAGGDDIAAIFAELATKPHRELFVKNKEVDFTWEYRQRRYRIHIYRRLGRIAFAIRVFPWKIPALVELGQASGVQQFMDYDDGLFLVTGATGAGKTTTVAAMLAEYNRTRDYHILTLEDPVEYLYPKGRCLFSQQELGRDFNDYHSGIVSAMRENPDIIMIAELRDGATCEAALSAAASGHYVIATMHTGGAVETVERIISMVDSSRQNLARSMLASALRGVCSQKLYRGKAGSQHCGVELLKVNNAARNIIRNGKYEQLNSVMQSGGSQGMQTMEMAVEALRQDGLLRAGRDGNRYGQNGKAL